MRKLIITALLLLPATSSAATLRFDPPQRAAGSADVIMTTLHLDVDPGECVNAASIGIAYPRDLLVPNVVSHGESIFTIWLDEQVDRDHGTIHFTGGIPGGYCGRANGDPGQSDIVAKLVFQYKGVEGSLPAQVTITPDTQVTLNDGAGTLASVTSVPYVVSWSATSTGHNDWVDTVQQDTFPPEPFEPTIEQNPADPHSPFYLFFDTQDKQSGVSYYEVLEDDPGNFGFHFGNHINAHFARATSPYILQDQTLSSRIIVRAYDFAGNMQEAIIPPKNASRFFGVYASSSLVLPIAIGGVVALIFVGSVIWMRRRKDDEPGEGENPNLNDENEERS